RLLLAAVVGGVRGRHDRRVRDELCLLLQYGRDRQQGGQRDDGRVGVIVGVDGEGAGERRLASAGREQVQEAGDLARRGLDELAPSAEQARRVRRVVLDLCEDDVGNVVRLELERGHDPEVATRTAQRPEQVRVLGGVC